MPQRKHTAGTTDGTGQKIGGQFAAGEPNTEGAKDAIVQGAAALPMPEWNGFGEFFDPASSDLIEDAGYIDVRGLSEFADDERVFYDGRGTVVLEKLFDFTTLAPAGLSREAKLAWCEHESYWLNSGATADGGYYPIDEPDTWGKKWWGLRAEVGDVADDTEDQFGCPTAPELLATVNDADMIERMHALHARGVNALFPRGVFPKA